MVKAILLGIGAYVVTLAVAAIASGITMELLAPRGCSAVSDAVGMLIAVLFVVSVVIVGLRARKIMARTGGRVAIIGVYSGLMAVSYVVIAFGLMVAFNC